MKPAICALLFLLACKSESKPAEHAAETPTPTEVAPKQARPRPALPDSTGSAHVDESRPRPQLPDQDDGEPRDWTDPAQREEMRAVREERRKQREAQLDTNKDGVLSPEERAQRMVPMHKRLDGNGDGKVTPDELAASDRRMGFDDPAAVDTDNSGDISLGELETAVTARREEMRKRWRGRGGRGSANIGPQ